MERAQPAAARAARRLGRVGGVRGGRARRGRSSAASATRTVYRTDHDGGFVGMSFRFFDPTTRQWSIYWADSRRPGLLDPPVIGSFTGDVGVFEGDDTFKGRPIRVRFIWSRRDDADARAGSRRSRTTAARPGRRTGSTTSHGSEETDERRPGRLPAPDEGDRARAGDRARRQRAQVVRHRAGRRAGAGADPGAGAREPARGRRLGRDRPRRRPRLRDPAPLRRELLLPPRLDLAQRQRALGDGLGEGRRRRPASVRGRSRGRTGRRSASGSSAPSGTSSRRGAASSARSATRRRGRRTCATPTTARSSPRCRAALRTTP